MSARVAFGLAGRWLVALAAVAVMALGGGILAAGAFWPAVTAADTSAGAAADLLDAIDDTLDIPQLSEKSYLYDAAGNLLTEFYLENRIVVPLERISQDMQNAVIALEDHRFWEHGGVDLQGMLRAFFSNAAVGQQQGASTITQQYVKNALIAKALQDDNAEGVIEAGEISYVRKIKEAKLATALERRVGKEKVLEGYLNIAMFGPSVYGVEAAAQYYFGVSAKDLNALQSATIAAVTQSPMNNDPVHNPQRNKARRDAALDAMERDHYITTAEHDQYVATDVTASLNITPPKSGCEEADQLGGAGFFCDYVTGWLANSEEFAATAEERQLRRQMGGLHIFTTLDPQVQAAAKAAVDWRIPPDHETGMGTALAAVEPGSGKIKAMAQNRRYVLNASDASGTSVNYNVDQATGGATGFQVGSTFKPIVLAEWLSMGKALREPVGATRSNYQGTTWQAWCEPEGSLKVLDNWTVRGSAKSNALDGTIWSSNPTYAAMEYQLDLCSVADMAASLGVTRADGQAWDHYPSQVFGSNEVTPLAMAGAYATFAAEGEFCEPMAVEMVKDAQGEVIAKPEAHCSQVLDVDVARGVNLALQQVVSSGTGTRAQLEDGRPVAGKTGTTDNSMAVWFIGYTPQLAAATWAGNPVAASEGLQGDFQGAFGGTLMAEAFKLFMDAALTGLPPVAFERPSDLIERGKQRSVPDVVGLSQEQAEDRLRQAGFTVQVADQLVDGDLPEGVVVGQGPAAGTWAYPGTVMTLQLSSGHPPEPEPEPEPDAGGAGLLDDQPAPPPQLPDGDG